MDSSWTLPRVNSAMHRPDLEQIERWTRETAWENEGGRVLNDDNRAAAGMIWGNAANDNGAAAP